jgi:nucleoside-diphosphate kinase
MERTLVLLKPDLCKRHLTGAVLAIYEQQGLAIEQLKLLQPTRELAVEHYFEHVGRPYFDGLINYLTRGDVVAVVLAGDQAISRVRTINGATDPAKAAADSVRGRYAISTRENSVHASDSPENAAREINLWFGRTD